MLKPVGYAGSTISRRQEVGRGLRLCVDNEGRRIDDPSVVHDVNVLTVVANESFHDFVSNLQGELRESLSASSRSLDDDTLVGNMLPSRAVHKIVDDATAEDRIAAEKSCSFDTGKLISRCVKSLDRNLRVSVLQYEVFRGMQNDSSAIDEFDSSEAFAIDATQVDDVGGPEATDMRYDLLGRLSEATQMTRRTIGAILTQITEATFRQYRIHPEEFLIQAAR